MGLLGNVRFRRTFWEVFAGESWGGGGGALIAEGPSVVGVGCGQAVGGIDACKSAARGERKPGGVACGRWHAGQ